MVIAAWRLLESHVRVVTAPLGRRVGRPGEGGGVARERERDRRITAMTKQQRETRAVGRGAQALPDPAWHAIEAATKQMVKIFDQLQCELVLHLFFSSVLAYVRRIMRSGTERSGL